jgi:glycosyltransferase involved in cell wall biosynthesis
MIVLQINSFYGSGSTGRIVSDIQKLLISKGHESYVIYGRGKKSENKNNIKVINKLGLYYNVIKTRLFDTHGLESKRITKKIVQKIKEINPDVIHLHNIHGYYINYKILFDYLKQINTPVIWTLHDCWAFTGHCAYFDFAGCDKWKTECSKCPEKKSYPKSILLDSSKYNYKTKKDLFTGHNNLTIVTPSKWLKNLVELSFLKSYNVEVINNGIDLDVFKPENGDFRQKYNLEDKFLILGVASVWDRRKGLNYFFELNNLIGSDEQIVLVGLNKKQIKQLPKGIIGISRTENIKELVNIYSSCDVFVNPTLEDNFPTTNLEAQACGTPVITFNTGGSPESLYHNFGAVTQRMSANSIRDAINSIKKVTNKDITRNLCNHAKIYNKFSKFGEYLYLYINLTDNILKKGE